MKKAQSLESHRCHQGDLCHWGTSSIGKLSLGKLFRHLRPNTQLCRYHYPNLRRRLVLTGPLGGEGSLERASSNGLLDLPQLRVWIARLASDYEQVLRSGQLPLTSTEKRKYRDAIRSAANSCEGKVSGSGKGRIRELIAVGVSGFYPIGELPPNSLLPEQIAIDFAVSALWPLVIVPKLPKSYLDDLSQISSEPLARQVAHARLARTSGPGMSVDAFGRAIANSAFAPGVLNLLNDLADPRRGGCALTAASIAGSGNKPPQEKPFKIAAAWLLSAAAAGVVGNRADDALTNTLDWLHQSAHNSATSHGDGHSASGNHSGGNHGNHGNRQSGEGAARFIEEFIHSFFR
jgi:hypothetical protein